MPLNDKDIGAIARAISGRGKLVVETISFDAMEARIRFGDREWFAGVSQNSPSKGEQLLGALEHLARALREQEEREQKET